MRYQGKYVRVESDEEYPKTFWIVNMHGQLLDHIRYPYWDLGRANRRAQQEDERIQEDVMAA